MNEHELIKWKERATNKTYDIVCNIEEEKKMDLRSYYPEFSFEGAYSTSLDPYVPLWASIPFFERIIVGILPNLKTETDFLNWYGLSPKQMLNLHEKGRINVRILYPKTLDSTPEYLDDLFYENFPTTQRDFEYNKILLDDETRGIYSERFRTKTSQCKRSTSIDTFKGDKSRALKTAETAYLQLIGLGFHTEAQEFESLLVDCEDSAFKWLETCRLLLIGPVHYSIGGIHSIGNKALFNEKSLKNNTVKFPKELGVVLINAFELVKQTTDIKKFTLEDCVNVYENSSLARETLISLDNMVKKSEIRIDTVEDLKKIFRKAKKRDLFWLKTLKIAAAVSVSIPGMFTAPYIGLLSGAGFSFVSEKSKKLENIYQNLAHKIGKINQDPSLTLLVELDEDVRNNYHG